MVTVHYLNCLPAIINRNLQFGVSCGGLRSSWWDPSYYNRCTYIHRFSSRRPPIYELVKCVTKTGGWPTSSSLMLLLYLHINLVEGFLALLLRIIRCRMATAVAPPAAASLNHFYKLVIGGGPKTKTKPESYPTEKEIHLLKLHETPIFGSLRVFPWCNPNIGIAMWCSCENWTCSTSI